MSILTSVAGAPQKWAYGAVAILLSLALGGALGFKLGHSLGTATEHKLTEACEKKVTGAVEATSDKINTGQTALAGSISEASASTSDSAQKRQEVLDAARASASSPGLAQAPSPSSSKVSVAPNPRAGAASSQPVPCLAPGQSVIPLTTVRVINQLLEISNETPVFDLSPLPSDGPGAAVAASADGLHECPDGSECRDVLLGGVSAGLSSQGAADLLPSSVEDGGSRILTGGVSGSGEPVGLDA